MEGQYCFFGRVSPPVESDAEDEWDMVSASGMTICSINTECSQVSKCTSYRDALLVPAKNQGITESENRSRRTVVQTSAKSLRSPKSNPSTATKVDGDSDENHFDSGDATSIPSTPRGYMKGNLALGYRRSAGNGSRSFCRCSACTSGLAAAKAGHWPHGTSPYVPAAGGHKASREYILYNCLSTGSREKDNKNKSRQKRCKRRENRHLIKDGFNEMS